MPNLDLYELRQKLQATHESQGVSKSIAMKLMQELDEARAVGRKEWGRANKAEEKVSRIGEALEGFFGSRKEIPGQLRPYLD